jgi:hypothetical protein
MSEQVVPDVIDLLCSDRYAGKLRWIHVPDSRQLGGAKGFPDFLIAGPAGIILRECKPRRDSHLSPHQTTWRYMLVAAGVNYAVWATEDLEDGTIQRELDSLSKIPPVG